MMFFEINVSPKEKKASEPTGRGQENNYSLLLARFQPTTKIKLDCQINKSVECNITLNNTNQCPLKISITKTPPKERCLNLNGEEWSLEPNSSIILNIKWQPQESGSWRDILQLTDSRRIKYDVPLTLVCTDPHKKANGKAGKPKPRNMLGCRTNIKTQNVNNFKPPVSNKINTQLSTKRTRSVASGLTDKENVPSNVDINWVQEQTIAKKQKKDQTPTQSNFSKLLDSSAFKFTPIKSQLPNKEIDKADASWIFSQEASLAAEKKTDLALRKETYITVPKFIHAQPSPKTINTEDNKKCDNSILPQANEEVKEKHPSEISALFNDIQFTPLKDSHDKKNNDNINFSPNFCSTVQKPKRSSRSIDEDLKNNSESKNATFSISSANNSEESISKFLDSPSKPKSNFHLKPTCLAATFDNTSINIEFSNAVPSGNNFSILNNLKTPKRCSNVFSKSQADCGSLKDCLEADLWVKAKTSLSPITKNFLHSTLDSISEEHVLEIENKDCSVTEEKSQKLDKSKNFRFEISPPKKHIFTKPSIRKVSPMKSSKIMKDKSTSEIINYKKKVQNSINCDKTTKKPVSSLIEKLSLAGLAKTSDKSKLLAKQLKEVSVKLHDPNDFLSIFCNPDPFAPTMTQDPFLASTHYYDDQWIFVQDLEFKKWLNALLSPPEHLTTDVESAPIDFGKIWQTCRGKDNVTLAETKESVSARYHTNSRLNILRKAAVAMYRKPEVVETLSKTTIAIEKQLMTIRQDKDLHRDIGLQKMILELFICYNPLWLRIGLEAIYGETIPLQSNNDLIGLSRFIFNRFFSDPFIVKTHSSTMHPNIRLKTFQPTINKFMLKKFLFLVYFLDYAKRNQLIGHDPCLFHKKGKYKSSRKILIEFSKELLSGIGDVTKVLKKYDYTVSHEQTYLDEFDYAVVNLCTDLKDGVRLCRVMELITGKRCLTCRCRVPAISLLQKIHNVDVALTALNEAGYTIKGNITPRNIAEGHKEKTLSLLWQIIYKFQAPKFEKAATTLQTWWRAKLWYVRVRNFLRMRKHNAASTIQRSWRCFLARRQLKSLKEEYNRELRAKVQAAVKIQRLWKLKKEREEQKRILEHRNASALKIQRWWRDLQETKPYIDSLKKNIQLIINTQRRWRAQRLMKLHRRQFVDYRNSVIAVQRRWRAKRLGVQESLNYQRKRMAIIFVQNKWRAKCLMKAEREVFLKKLRAVKFIQNWWRRYLLLKRDRNYFLALKNSVKKIEKIWIANHTVTEERKRFLLLKNSAVVIKKNWRNYHATKPDVSLYKRKKMSCLKIQSWWRSAVVQRKYSKQRSSCIKVQKWWRSVILTRNERAQFLKLKNSAIAIQKNWKMIQARRNFSLKKDSVLKIEVWRKSVILTRKLRNEFLKQKSSARVIETWWSALKIGKKNKADYLKARRAAVILQQRWRAQREMKKTRREYLRLRNTVLKIQSWYRMVVQKQLFKKLKERNSAALVLQTRWRALKIGRQERAVFASQIKSMIFVQRKWRSILLTRKERGNFLQKRESAIIMQKNWRKFVQLREFKKLKDAVRVIENWRANLLVGRRIREDYLKLKAATVRCQNLWRGKQQLKYFKKQRNSAIVIQKNWRRFVQLREFKKLKDAVRVIENRRANLLVGRRIREDYLKLKAVTVKCQNLWRAKQHLKLLKKQRNSALIIQKNWRSYRESKKYKKTKDAVIIIQRWIRHLNHGKCTRSRFVQLRNNVINLQRLWRMALQMKEFRRKRAAAIVFQKNWKRLVAMRAYEKQKIAVLFIENWRKHLLLGRQIRNEYLTFRRAAVTIQQHFRVKLQVRAYREKRQAVVTIQRYWRSVIETRRCKNQLEKLKSAAVVVQRHYRAKKVGEVARKNYLITVSAAFSLQRWWRGVLYSKKLEILNKKKQWAVNVIEKWYIRVREQQRVRAIQRAELFRLHDAATKIQTAWRGFRVRQAASKRMSVLRKRAEIATEAATPSATLAFRLQENIEIFKFAKNIGELSICLASLDVITRLSPNACVNVCQLNLVSKLYDILTKANRSLPWMDVSLKDISILLNLAKFDQTTAYVMKEESVEDLAKLLKISIDKKEDLFLHTATLVWILTENEEYLQAVKNSASAMYLLTSLCTTNQRKIKALQNNVKQKGISLPNPKPDWGLKHKQPRVFTNVAQAVSCISSRLKILNIVQTT